MKTYKYKVKVGKKYVYVFFTTKDLEKIFDYYNVEYEKIKDDK